MSVSGTERTSTARSGMLIWIVSLGPAMRRREFLGALCAIIALPRSARAQQDKKIYRIGLLSGSSMLGALDERSKSLTAGLAQRGFAEGRNLVIEQRWADGRIERLAALAAELQADNVDVIVTYAFLPPPPAKMPQNKLQPVIPGRGDPEEIGWVI